MTSEHFIIFSDYLLCVTGDTSPPADIKSWFKCQGRGKTRDSSLAKFPHGIYAIGTQVV